MKHKIIKVILFAFLFCFLFRGLDWAKPLTIEQTENFYSSEAPQNHNNYATQSIRSLTQHLENDKISKKSEYPKNIKPASMFLFGSGMIGFGIIARRKI